MSVHVVTLGQEDVAVSPAPAVLGTAVVALTPRGLARLDEARTKHGALAVFVRLEFPSDEFYPKGPE
jgi:hypothetical protein